MLLNVETVTQNTQSRLWTKTNLINNLNLLHNTADKQRKHWTIDTITKTVLAKNNFDKRPMFMQNFCYMYTYLTKRKYNEEIPVLMIRGVKQESIDPFHLN